MAITPADTHTSPSALRAPCSRPWFHATALTLVLTFLTAAVNTGCTSTRQVVADRYREQEGETPVDPATWSSRTRFLPTAGPGATRPLVEPNQALSSDAVADLPQEAIRSARPLVLEGTADEIRLVTRQNLCLRVDEQRFANYENADYVGGWKTTAAVAAFLGAAGAAGLGYGAYRNAELALPSSAMLGNPYVAPGTQTREEWQGAATLWFGGALGLATTGAIAIALNWWTAKERVGQERKTVGQLGDCVGNQPSRVVFLPRAATLGARTGEAAYAWQNSQGASAGPLSLVNPDNLVPLVLLRELLVARQTGILPMTVQAEIRRSAPGSGAVPLTPDWSGQVDLRLTDGNVSLRQFAMFAVRQIQPAPNGPLVVAWSADQVLVGEAPCRAAVAGLSAVDRMDLSSLTGGELIDNNDLLLVAHPAPLRHLPLNKITLNGFGPPTSVSFVAGEVAGKCVARWSIPSDLSKLGAWARSIAESSELPGIDALGASRWVSEADRIAAARSVLAALAPQLDVRFRELEPALAGAKVPGNRNAELWPAMSDVAELVRTRKYPAARAKLLGPVTGITASLCSGAAKNDSACKSAREFESAAAVTVRAAALPLVAAQVEEAIKASACREDLSANVGDNPAKRAAEACLSEDWAVLAEVVGPKGALPEPALAAKLASARRTAVAFVVKAIARAKSEAAAEMRREAAEEADRKAQLEEFCRRTYGTRCPTQKEIERALRDNN